MNLEGKFDKEAALTIKSKCGLLIKSLGCWAWAFRTIWLSNHAGGVSVWVKEVVPNGVSVRSELEQMEKSLLFLLKAIYVDAGS